MRATRHAPGHASYEYWASSLSTPPLEILNFRVTKTSFGLGVSRCSISTPPRTTVFCGGSPCGSGQYRWHFNTPDSTSLVTFTIVDTCAERQRMACARTSAAGLLRLASLFPPAARSQTRTPPTHRKMRTRTRTQRTPAHNGTRARTRLALRRHKGSSPITGKIGWLMHGAKRALTFSCQIIRQKSPMDVGTGPAHAQPRAPNKRTAKCPPRQPQRVVGRAHALSPRAARRVAAAGLRLRVGPCVAM